MLQWFQPSRFCLRATSLKVHQTHLLLEKPLKIQDLYILAWNFRHLHTEIHLYLLCGVLIQIQSDYTLLWQLPCLLHKSATETFLLETNSRTGTMAAFQTTTSRFISTYNFLSISSNFQCKFSISCTKSLCSPTKKGEMVKSQFWTIFKTTDT